METIEIFDVKVHPLTVGELHQIIENKIISNKKSIIANVNVHALNLTFKHCWLKGFFNSAPIVFCDGAGVVLGARLLGHKIPKRITYADWMWQLAEFASNKGFSFYFLGAKEGVAEKAADSLTARFPNIQILGTHHGYFNKSPGSYETKAIIKEINNAKPNILVLGFGMPLQELWLMENWGYIDAGIALTGGAVFDYVSGEVKRAPNWMLDHGLEWLGRMLIEPKRLWKRYIYGNPLFITRILLQKFGLLQL
jgi:N-acetylglucosaminyldiphosphoundecaprenol N-acetyl-beta-D-mannosaminyltransferase